MADPKPTILLIGLGHLGGVLLEFFAREDWIGRVVGCSRGRTRGEARCNLARLGAVAQGLAPTIDYRQVDISRPFEVAEILDSVQPDLVISTATMQTWWLPELLPPEARTRLEQASFGMWLPLHLAPTLALMQSIAASSYAGPVLTAPFPDVVNCVLGRIGLAPTCGIGNIDELVAKVRWMTARHLGAPLETIDAVMVGHHALESAVFKGSTSEVPPYFLKVTHQGVDVSESLPVDEILLAPLPLPAGPDTAFFTTGSALRLIRAILAEEDSVLHAPAPSGLPGGYPVIVGRRRVDNAPIAGLELGEAIDINERSHRFDGIEAIRDDGTAAFVAESVDVMRTELGYDCPQLAPADAEDRGLELAARFREYAGRHGVDLNRSL